MSRRAAGGSRYPSAYGHTPSYRSYVSGAPSGISTPSSLSLGGAGDSYSARPFDDLANMGMSSTGLYSKPSSGFGSGISGNNSSSVMSSSTSYNSVSTSNDGRAGIPKVEYSTDKSYHSTTDNGSGIPRTSHAVSSSGYSSSDPYKNKNFSYSYNV